MIIKVEDITDKEILHTIREAHTEMAYGETFTRRADCSRVTAGAAIASPCREKMPTQNGVPSETPV